MFPRTIDNDYRGQWLAIWLLVPVLFLKLFIGFNIAGFNPLVSNRGVLTSVDGIPLDSFGAEAAQTVVFFAASWGLNMTLLALLAILALIRYRTMLPIVLILFTAEQVGRTALSAHYFPGDGDQTLSVSALINWGFTAALVLGFILSLVPRRRRGSLSNDT